MAQAVVETGAIAERFNRDGFHFPLPVLSEGEALACRAELERLEARIVTEKLGHKNQINHGAEGPDLRSRQARSRSTRLPPRWFRASGPWCTRRRSLRGPTRRLPPTRRPPYGRRSP